MELVEFLLARIDEDEAVATRWPEDEPPPPPDRPYWIDAYGHPIWAPRARVLAECAAKRRLVQFAQDVVADMDDRIQGEWGSGPIVEEHREDLAMLRLLAQPYADHDDYDPAWNPEATA